MIMRLFCLGMWKGKGRL